MCLCIKLKVLAMICKEVMKLRVVSFVLCVFIDIYLKFKMPHMVAVRWMRQGSH